MDRPETHWHLNTSILSDTAFRPHFAEFWATLMRSHPPEAAIDAADWWELTAKPACRVFCQHLSNYLLTAAEKLILSTESAYNKPWPPATGWLPRNCVPFSRKLMPTGAVVLLSAPAPPRLKVRTSTYLRPPVKAANPSKLPYASAQPGHLRPHNQRPTFCLSL